MRNKIRYFSILVLLLLSPLLMADMGPKPTAEFEIEYAFEPIPELTDYLLYQCKDTACEDRYALEELGPQHFDCTQTECSSMAYGYGDYLQMVLTFSDGVTRTSNIFTKRHFNAEYRVSVQTLDLLVEETGGSGNPAVTFLLGMAALICGVGVLLVVGIVRIVRSIHKKRREVPQPPAAN